MTRDQALLKLERTGWGRDYRAKFVDVLVDLEMLKLEESKSIDERIASALAHAFAFDTDAKEMGIFHRRLDSAGLQIVEK